MKRKLAQFFSSKLYMGMVCVAAFAAVVGVGLNTMNEKSAVLPLQNLPMAEEPAKIVDSNKNAPAVVEEPKEEAPVAEEPAAAETPVTAEAPATEPADEYEAAVTMGETQNFTWPADGNIVLGYSTESAIYDPTLEQYRTNDSICIAAPEGTTVKAAAAGQVTSVTEDTEKGVTVVIAHKNGWVTTYSQIQADVAPGESVSAGQAIGAVSTPTKYGVALGSHLDFKMTLDGNPTDPTVALAE